MKMQHYYLVSGTVMFRDKDDESQVGALALNTVSRCATPSFPTREIGRAQQALQMLFFKKIEDATCVVFDVVLNSVSYLGEMTEEDFLAPPEGMVQQELTGQDKLKVN